MSKPSSSGGFSKYFSGAKDALSGLAEKLPDAATVKDQLRDTSASYSSQNTDTLKLHLAIKASGSSIHSLDSVARDSRSFAVKLSAWGSDNHGADIADVSDRLAEVLYREGETFDGLKRNEEQARTSLKDIRNFEDSHKAKNPRASVLKADIAKLRAAKVTPDTSAKIASLEHELTKLEAASATFSSELAGLKRTKLHASFAQHFSGIREAGEKLLLLAAAGEALLDPLDGGADDYKGAEHTGQVKAKLVEQLDSWAPGKYVAIKDVPSAAGTAKDTRSFKDSHAAALGGPVTPTPAAHAQEPIAVASPAAVRPTPPIPAAAPAVPAAAPSVAAPAAATAAGGAAAAGGVGYATYHSKHNTSAVAGAPVTSAALSVGSPSLAATSAPAAPLSPPVAAPSTSTTAAPIAPVDSSSSIASTSSDIPLTTNEPTIAETGATLSGTGGPSSGQLAPAKGASYPPEKVTHLADLGPVPPPALGAAGLSPASPPAPAPVAAQTLPASVSSDLRRMDTTSRRRLEASELATEGEDLPDYTEGFSEQGGSASREDVARAQAQQILAAERENKAAPPA